MRPNLVTVCCLLALPGMAEAAGNASAQWRDYARSSMTPAFEWAAQAEEPKAALAESAASGSMLMRDATLRALANWRGGDRLALEFSAGAGGSSLITDQASSLVARSRSAFVSGQANTSLTQSFSSQSELSLTAIIARSRFATPGMGASPWQSVEQFTGVRQSGVQEVSEGGGVAVAFRHGVTDDVVVSLSLQSRLDMDAFKAYRGIYSEAGDFDLPGNLRSGFEWSLGNRFAVGADVQRVMYSDIDAFTSAQLPTRFLALLGDGSSPEFRWQDLTVYSAEAALLDDLGGRWSLRYSTQQQPRPTSALLSRALANQYADGNIGFGYRRALGSAGEFQFAASYAPAAYVMASAPFVQLDFDGGSQIEVEAQWTLAF